MKTLKSFQILVKLGRILSKIVYICGIIGAVGCVVGIISLPFADKGLFKIGGVTIYGLISDKSGLSLDGLYPMMTGALIVCVGQAITAKFAEIYFKNVLTAGTPFTFDGARELMRLGIITVCVPLGALILAQIVSGVVAEFAGSGEAFKLDGGDSVSLGVMFIVMSLLCKCGAEAIDHGSDSDEAVVQDAKQA